MPIPEAHAKAIAEFPPALQDLIKAELEAGNEIIECSHGFPAPPVGMFVKLAKKVSTRPAQSDSRVQFFQRNSSSYSGEFTDSRRFFFVLEPPLPPEPEPDMNAIRAEREARQRTADAALYAQSEREHLQRRGRTQSRSMRIAAADCPATVRNPLPRVERFRESMAMNYERWHDGIGYDLELLRSATAEERAQIDELLINHGVKDWRDVEALAEINSPRAQLILREAFLTGSDQVRVALLRHAPELFSEQQRTTALVSALEHADVYEGLSQALLLVDDFHPPQVIEALLRGVLVRDGATAGEFAAMLLFLHGKASSPYDMAQRPFFLKFQGGDRQVLCRELCERIGIPGLPACNGEL